MGDLWLGIWQACVLVALIDIGSAMSAVQRGLHKDFTSSIVVTPWGMIDPAEAGTGHDIPFNCGTNVKQNHALLLLGRAIAADGVTGAQHVTIMTKGFTAAMGVCPARGNWPFQP